MKSLHGYFLVASPYLPDPNFMRSVVLIVSHDDDHAFGLIMNRPSRETVANVWQKATGSETTDTSMLRIGGPLEGPLMVIHRMRDYADSEILPGVFIASQREHVVTLMMTKVQTTITLSGYAGWGPGQLEQELRVGGWMVIPATEELVFAAPDQMWHAASDQVGADVLQQLNLPPRPEDPNWN